MEALEFPALPDVEPIEHVHAGQDRGAAYGLLATYNRLLENIAEIGHLHFEMLGLGYGAYVTFGDLCRTHFPDIRDQTIAQMVAGIDILMFRPDDELEAARARGGRARRGRADQSGGDADAGARRDRRASTGGRVARPSSTGPASRGSGSPPAPA